MAPALIQGIADALSTVTILSCLFLKVPQIMNVKARGSAGGIYVQAMMMEITGFSITTLYNFTNRYSVITYLEYPIILIQIYVLLYYVLKFKGMLDNPIVSTGTVLYVITVTLFCMEIAPKSYLSYMVPFCTPLSGFAKVTYVYGIVKSGNADSVSLTTWIISAATNIARIFTVYVDSADVTLLLNFTVSTLLSLSVLLTALYYQLKSKSDHIKKSRKLSQTHSD